MSGGVPNAPSRAASTHKPGGPATAHAGVSHSGISTRFTSMCESGVEHAERGTGSARIEIGRGHDGVVARGGQCSCEYVEAFGVDAVVVGDQDPHAAEGSPARQGRDSSRPETFTRASRLGPIFTAFTIERRRRIASSVPAATQQSPNMTGPVDPLPVWGRGPPFDVVEDVVGTVLP